MATPNENDDAKIGFPLQIIPILCVTHIIWTKPSENFKMAYGN